MLAIFNGAHTIRNRQTGEHRTFEIRTVRNGSLKGKRIISLLTGPDNNSHYKSFGFVKDDGNIVVWNKYKGNGNKSIWEQYAMMVKFIIIDKNQSWTDRYEQWVEGACIRCNRKLTHPESIVSGIGPECAKKGML